MLLSSISGMSAGTSQIVLTLYAVAKGATPSQIGLIVGMHGFGLLFTVLPVGFLVDHIGPRKVFIFGAFSTALIYLLFPLAGTFPLLCVFSGLVGFFTAFRFVPISSVVIEFVRNSGSDKAGLLRGSNSLGVVLFGPLLGAFLSRYVGFSNAFHVLAFIALLLVAGAVVTLPDSGRSGSRTSGMQLSDLKKLFGNRSIVEASLAESLGGATLACFNTFAVVIAIRVLHIPVQFASVLVSIQGLTFIATLFTLSRLLDRLGHRSSSLVSIGVIMTALLLLSCHQHPAFLFAGSICLGVGLGIFNLVNITRIAHANVAKGGSAGVFALFSVSGSIIGPVIGGFTGEHFGTTNVFFTFVPLYLALSLMIYIRSTARKTSVVDELLRHPVIDEP
ncbi:MAG: MFS transporter [Chlorobiaceae bacterium]|nr:MFS transporter [Chlorobiaceae bacterium]